MTTSTTALTSNNVQTTLASLRSTWLVAAYDRDGDATDAQAVMGPYPTLQAAQAALDTADYTDTGLTYLPMSLWDAISDGVDVDAL